MRVRIARGAPETIIDGGINMYGSIEYRQARDIYLRSWLDSKSQIIDNISENYFKALCYFSLIENFAQEYFNYPTSNQNADSFCKFIIKFNSSYTFLDEYDPVTLYYDFETQLEQSFDLSFLDYGINYKPDQAVLYGKASEMVQYLNEAGIDRRIEKHKFVRLLYSYRSKLSHELFNQHSMLATDLHLLPEYPYYISCSRSYETEDGRVRNNYWDLVVPIGLIKKLALECISNYLDYSLENKNDPFENNRIDRKSVTAWYD